MSKDYFTPFISRILSCEKERGNVAMPISAAYLPILALLSGVKCLCGPPLPLFGTWQLSSASNASLVDFLVSK